MGRTAKKPGKPKGKMSAYTFYVQETREELKKKEPNKTHSLASVSKVASETWKTMSDEQKQKYVDMSLKDGERYKEEMANYTPAEEVDGKKRKRSKKDPNAPKRAMSAFFCFANEERAKVKAAYPKLSVGEVAKELGKRWEALKDKSKFEEIAAKDKARYVSEKADYDNGQSNGVASKKPAAKAAKKSKPPAKKAKRGKETEEEDEDEEDEVDEDEDEDEDEEDDGGESD